MPRTPASEPVAKLVWLDAGHSVLDENTPRSRARSMRSLPN